MSIEDNKKVVRSYFTAGDLGDYDAAFALFADGAKWRLNAQSGVAFSKSKAEMHETMINIGTLFPKGFKITVKAMTAEGDRVAVEAESYGEYMNGKIYNNLYHFLFEVRDGKIQAVREYCDTLHAQQVTRE
jgi:ketosteroid isomerase-like protein